MSVSQIPAEYSWKVAVTSYDVGQERTLRPSSQLRLQQEVGERHFEIGGLGFEELAQRQMAFVLTRMNTVIYRAPHVNEHITLVTWHRQTKGAQFYRNYQFLDEQGRTLIDSVTAFALVDPQSHKLLRPQEFERLGVRDNPEHSHSCPDPARNRVPSDLQPAGTRHIRWSDIDFNGHLNNAVYADIACDVMPGGMQNKRITGFSITFAHEAKEGDTLHLRSGIVQDNDSQQAWITGDLPSGRSFEACFRFAYQETTEDNRERF